MLCSSELRGVYFLLNPAAPPLIVQGMWQDAVLKWQTGFVPPDTMAIEELLQPEGAPQLPLVRLVALALSVGAVETICSTFRRQLLGEFAAIGRAPTR